MSARAVKGFHLLQVMRRNRIVNAEHRVHMALGEAYEAGFKQAIRESVKLFSDAQNKNQTDAVLSTLRQHIK